MASLPTSSFRAPAEVHALVRQVAQALTRHPELAEPIKALLAQAGAEGAAVPAPDWRDVVARLDVLERLVAEHGVILAMQRIAVGAEAVQAEDEAGAIPCNTDAIQDSTASEAEAPAVRPASTAPAAPWTTGEDRRRRLTAAGLAELDRRLQAGESVATIATALGGVGCGRPQAHQREIVSDATA